MKNKIEKIVLWKDEGQITAMRQQLESLLPIAQRIASNYHEMPFAETEIDFFDLFANTESKADSYIKKLAANAPAPEGLAIDANKFAQLYRLPALDAFREAKQAFIQAGGDRSVSYFRMKGQAVEIDPVAFERFAAQHTISVEEENRELYRLWKNMADSLVAFDRAIKSEFNFLIGLTVPKMGQFLREDKNGQIGVNPQLFQTVSKALNKKHTS